MTPQSVRIVRRALAVGLLLLSVSVGWSLRRAPATPSPAPTPAATEQVTRTKNFTYEKFEGDRLKWSLKARDWMEPKQGEQPLRGVEFTFSYASQGQAQTGRISSDSGSYEPATQRAVFEGHVRITTGDGFELTTESLTYRGDKNIARTDAQVEFQRKDLTGRSRGLVYRAEEGLLELPADVAVFVQDPDKAATEIRAGRAVLVREESTLRFEDGVEVVQAADRLTARRFELEFGADRAIYRARAIDHVVWRSASGALPGTTPGPATLRGSKHLTARKLDLWFGSRGVLQEATAGPDADLTILPGANEGETRRLKARFLTFRFDGHGGVEELKAFRDVVFDATPPGGKGEARSLSCVSLEARIEPTTAEPRVIEFTKNVAFQQGSRRATSQKAYYDGSLSVLFLVDRPELVDETEKSRLQAQAIDLSARSGDVVAREGVRHVFESRAGAPRGLLADRQSALLVTSRLLDYTAATRTARYQGEALLRSARDEIRAVEIRVKESGGKRRLEASGGVVSLLHPQSRAAPASQPPAIDARSREMVYDEAENKVVYRGEVAIRRGQVTIRSPEATLALSPDGATVGQIEAGEPVEVEQGDRRATGRRGTYMPETETLVLVGEKVRFTDPSQEVEGRSLTFRVGDDRIVVDGQEQVRTQTIIKSHKEPSRP